MDGVLKSIRIDSNNTHSFESMVHPLLCDDLHQFSSSVVTDQHAAYLLRYSSFSLPIRVFQWEPYASNRDSVASFDELIPAFKKSMGEIGFIVEEQVLEIYRKKAKQPLSYDKATELFMEMYGDCVARLVEGFSPDLVIWDEAQYLRTDANRNTVMRTIFGHLHQSGSRHLFMSATPAHRDASDINQLNHLLEDTRFEHRKLIQVQQQEGNAVNRPGFPGGHLV
jgi:hypothetical protein